MAWHDGGATLTGRALQQVAAWLRECPRTGLDRPPRAVVLMTEARSQDEVAGRRARPRSRGAAAAGCGQRGRAAELEMITGGAGVLTYTSPQDLFDQIPKLQGKLCNRPRPGRVHPTRANCGAQPTPDPRAWPASGRTFHLLVGT